MTEKSSLLVTLEQIMSDHDGSLDNCMTAQPDIQNVLIYWTITVDVKGRGKQNFLVGVAVCFTEFLAEEAKDQFEQLTAADANLIFAYVPAWQYGHADFSIFIEQTSFGDILTNSLVAEVVEKSAIEQTLIRRSNLL
jgi:hypothetical protein